MAMRSLQPQIKAIQQRYAGDQVTLTSPYSCMGVSVATGLVVPRDTQKNELLCFCLVGNWCCSSMIVVCLLLQEKIQIETARLYKLAGINPLAGR